MKIKLIISNVIGFNFTVKYMQNAGKKLRKIQYVLCYFRVFVMSIYGWQNSVGDNQAEVMP